MKEPDPIRVDRRRWTGPAWTPTGRDRREARAILRTAGAGVDAPQQGVVCVALVALLPMMATTGAWARLLGPADPAAWLRGVIAAWLGPHLGLKVAEHLAGLPADAHVLALATALLGAALGGTLAWRHRATLAQGFAALAAQRPDIAESPSRGLFFLPALLLATNGHPAGDGPMQCLAVLALWLTGCLMAQAMTASMMRLAAGRSVRGRGWDWANLVLALAALLWLLGQALR